MLVVFLFLRRTAATIAAGITVPLSLAGTCAAMWVAGFSIDNLSLMALAVCIGFVVDDAIVMIENMFRNLEKGALAAARHAEGRQADRLHRGVDLRVADRRVHSAAVHGRHRRPAVPRILGDAGIRHRRLDRGVAVGDADDLRLFRARGAEPRRHLARPPGRGRAVAHDRASTTARSPSCSNTARWRWSCSSPPSRSPSVSTSRRRKAISRRTTPG